MVRLKNLRNCQIGFLFGSHARTFFLSLKLWVNCNSDFENFIFRIKLRLYFQTDILFKSQIEKKKECLDFLQVRIHPLDQILDFRENF
jgi:hypothetical protein